jgi:hypothetical protein
MAAMRRPTVLEDNPEALDALVWTPRFLAAIDRLLLEETHGCSLRGAAGDAAGVDGGRRSVRDGSGTHRHCARDVA